MPLTRSRALVRDLMQVGVATCPPEALVIDIARFLLQNSLDTVIVLDPGEGHALGVVSWEEMMDVYRCEDARSLTAADVMREGVPQVPPDIPITAAVQIMRDQKIRTLFLMHHSGGIIYPAAYLTYSHLLRYLAARDEEDLRGLGVEAKRKNPVEIFIEKRDAARRSS